MHGKILRCTFGGFNFTHGLNFKKNQMGNTEVDIGKKNFIYLLEKGLEVYHMLSI